MSIPFGTRFSTRHVAAALLVLPLGLTACGGSESEDAAAAKDSTSSSAASTTKKATTTAASTTSSSSQASASAESSSEKAPEPDPQQPPAPPVGDNLPAPNDTPVEGGVPAGPEDSAAITNLVSGAYNVNTLHEFYRYIPEHTCTEVLDQQGGRDAFNDLSGVPDMPLNQIPAWVQTNPHVESVNDIMVNGDRASASVTAVGGDGPTTNNYKFFRENGGWTFCA